MKPPCREPVSTNLEEVPVVEGKKRSAVRRGTRKLILVPDAEGAHFVRANYVVTGGTKDTGEVGQNVFIEV